MIDYVAANKAKHLLSLNSFLVNESLCNYQELDFEIKGDERQSSKAMHCVMS